ncbi:hypothetical protein GCM10018954_022770 [Kutzneria kofuensis]
MFAVPLGKPDVDHRHWGDGRVRCAGDMPALGRPNLLVRFRLRGHGSRVVEPDTESRGSARSVSAHVGRAEKPRGSDRGDRTG